MITVKIFQAEDGDSILISLGEKEDINILVDMGRETTYKNTLKPELERINKNNNKLDLLIITHIDADHIKGALPFIEENGSDHNVIQVNEVWHNTYKHLQFDKIKNDQVSKNELNILNRIILQNKPLKTEFSKNDISVKDGVSFGGYLAKYDYKWNNFFDNKAVCIENQKELQFSNFKIIILSPNNESLLKLGNFWANKLENILYNFKLGDEEIYNDAYEFYMQNLNNSETILSDISSQEQNFEIPELAKKEEKDNSLTNASSIAFILEYESKKILMLGDANEKIIFENLSKLKNNGYNLDFDIVKLSHHGSNKNISQRLINLIESQFYIFSTDGKKHGHPNLESISKILMKKSKQKKLLVFNYDLPILRYISNVDLKIKYNFDIITTNKLTI